MTSGEDGMDAGEFWSYGGEDEEDFSFGAFFTGTDGWRRLLRYLLRRRNDGQQHRGIRHARAR